MPTGIYSRTRLNNGSLFKKGKHSSKNTEFKKGMIPWNKGKKNWMSAQGKASMIAKKIGKSTWNKGKHTWSGGKNPRWKNGIKIHGYRFISKKDHPYKDAQGYVREHRLIIEKEISRYLLPEETVHHINKNKLDNQKENLIAFKDELTHRRFEKYGKVDSNKIIFDGRR